MRMFHPLRRPPCWQRTLHVPSTKDPATLADLVGRALAEGRLPRARADVLASGFGLRGGCQVCGDAIGPRQLGVSTQVDGVHYRAHVACFASWQMALPPEWLLEVIATL